MARNGSPSNRDDPPPRPAPPAWIRVVLLVSGWLALAVGTAGIFLPILPTTPFIILAAACFSRGSRRTHAWILAHPWFGPTLREWESHGTVPARVKWTAIPLVVLSFGLSLVFVPPGVYIYVTLLAIAAALIVFLARLPTSRAK